MRRDPDGRPSLSAVRGFGVFVILMALGLGYYTLVRPLLEGMRTGTTDYSFKAVLLVPAFLYLGLAVQVADLRDGNLREIGPDSKVRFTARGRKFLIGLVTVMVAATAGWYLLLHVLGFHEV